MVEITSAEMTDEEDPSLEIRVLGDLPCCAMARMFAFRRRAKPAHCLPTSLSPIIRSTATTYARCSGTFPRTRAVRYDGASRRFGKS